MSNHENSNLGKCCFLEGENISAAPAVSTYAIPTSTSTSTVSAPVTARNSLLNQVLTGQALEEQSIANELSQTFTRRNFSNSSVRSSRRNNQGSQRNFDPVQGAASYYNMHVGRNRGREESIRESLVQVILLPDIGRELSSPMITQDKYKKMNDAGYIKDILFKESDEIVPKIEEVFPVLIGKQWTLRTSSTKGKTIEYTPPNGIITYATIKRVLVNKNKLYISPIWESLPLQQNVIENQQQDHFRSESTTSINSIDIDNVITVSSSPIVSLPILSPIISSATIPSTSTAITSFNSTITSSLTNSDNTPISRIYNNTTQTSNSTIRSDQSTSSTEITELTLYNNIDDFIEEIVVENTNNNDLLKKPVISVITKRVVDAGGVFMHVTQQFWDQIKNDESLFISNNDTFFISPNPLYLHFKKFTIIGKLLFWCLIHNGAWPHWLHKFHFRYIFNIEINYIQILKEIQPQVYGIIQSIRNFNEELKPGKIIGLNEWGYKYNLQETDLIELAKEEKDDLINFIAEHEIKNNRKSHLNDLKNGFNCFKLIEIIKSNIFDITWKNFEKKLYLLSN
ncbi:hypothetical protein GLOIN_2v1469659 [Rhizophagus clarus]|uniref:HECT domain-containing protein n=1 Tax=Rhizophagus clarus TaxID=94130 RepID=A0A8H3QKI1_9GLOM|nr:hypothetical protein GLOIN_2v1469659 [Rhizophagus clarus]